MHVVGTVAVIWTTVMAFALSLVKAVVVTMAMTMSMAMAMAVAMAMRVVMFADRVNGRLRCRCWPVSILAGDLNVSGGDGALRSHGRETKGGSPTGVFRVLAMTYWP